MKLTFHGDTDVGKQRVLNEDSYLILCDLENNWKEVNSIDVDTAKSRGIVFAVADGMGGSNAGEVASALAIKVIKEVFSGTVSFPSDVEEIRKLLDSIIYDGHARIIKEISRDKNLDGMGTTLVLGWIFKENIYVIWSGDSRCYIYNKNFNSELAPFTDDHSLVWERVKSNEISPEEARINDYSNIILQSLGGSSQKPEPDFKWTKLKKNDRILFCSDGLNSMLSNVGLQQILDFNPSSRETCESLINSAKNAGGRDNITAIVVDIIEEGLSESEMNEIKAIEFVNPGIKKKRNKIWLFLILGILIIGAVFTLFLINQIPGNTGKPIKDTSGKVLDESDSYSTVEIIDTIKSKIINPALPQSDSSVIKPQKEVKHQSNSKTVKPDNNLLINKLESSLKTIGDLRKRIEYLNSIATNEFDKKYRLSLDSIDKALNFQQDLIFQIAEVKLTEIFRILNYDLAVNKYSEIEASLVELARKLSKIELN